MSEKGYKELIDDIYKYCVENDIGIYELSKFIKGCCLSVLDKMTEPGSDFIVLKKDCRVEAYNPTKLYNSIANASDDIGEPLTESDIKNVIKQVQKQLKLSESQVASSLSISQEVQKALLDFGHEKVYHSFKNYP